jgi:hypothetical protein
MAKRLELARPMMRRCASLNTNGGMAAASRKDVAPLQLTADDHLAGRINTMYLKDRLGDVETDRRDCLHW